MRFSRLRRSAVVLFASAVAGSMPGGSGRAADPQPYTVEIAPTGDAALDGALRDSATLNTLREKGPVGPFALILRAQGDQERLATALRSFGYYKGAATIRVAGRPLDDPGLPELLQATPSGQSVPVAISVRQGPLFHLRQVAIDGALPAAAREKLGLKPGDPAVASDVLAAGGRLLDALRESGHALARVDAPAATEIPAADALDVSFKVDAGPRVDIGRIGVSGLERVNESYVRRRLLLHPGELYQPSRIEAARQDLANAGVFSSVRAQAADRLDPDGRIPVAFDVQERPRHVVGFLAAFSTDEGASAGATWSHRNLFGNAEQLNLHATATNLGGTATQAPGYDVGAQLVKPDFLRRDQSLTLNLQALKQSLDAYDQTAFIAGASLGRKLSPHWTGSVGVQAEQEQVMQEGARRDYTLLGLPVTARYDSTDSLFAPTRGLRVALAATPTASLAGGNFYAILQASGSTYLDIGGDGRSVLAVRATVGTIQGASTFQIPPDQRFYAGGSGTVRGYRYQSVGPQFPDRKPVGGTSLVAGTVEFRQRVWGNFGAAVFVDAGSVGSDSSPFSGSQLAVGAGGGVRYVTPIGPVRLDVAVPTTHVPGNDSFELYIGIGEAF